MSLEARRTVLQQYAAQRLLLHKELDVENERKTALTTTAKDLENARAFLQRAATHVQEQTHQQLASLVSRCLAAVFDNPYELRITFVQRRGKTEAELWFYRDGMCVDPLESAGGGVIDVAAFALRIAALAMSRPSLRPVLIMDEPFRFVSRDRRPRVRQLLESLSTELGIQFIIVTHHPELYCGNVLEVDALGPSSDA